jgi:hypothetical protein
MELIFKVCQFFALTTHKSLMNPIIIQTLVSSHSNVTISKETNFVAFSLQANYTD